MISFILAISYVIEVFLHLFTGAQVWTPFKELYHTVQYAIQHRQQDAIQDLEMALRRHRTEFIALLQNPVRKWMKMFTVEEDIYWLISVHLPVAYLLLLLLLKLN